MLGAGKDGLRESREVAGRGGAMARTRPYSEIVAASEEIASAIDGPGPDGNAARHTAAVLVGKKAAGIDALRLAGFENGLCSKAYPAPVGGAKAKFRAT